MAIEWEKIIKSLILLCFSILLFYLVVSGQIRMYINPRFTVLTELAAVALLLMFAVQLFYSHSCHPHDHKTPMWVYVIFIVPLSLAVLLPNAVLDASVASSRGLSFSSANSASAPLGSGTPAQALASGIDQGGSTGRQANDASVSTSGSIQVTPDNFVRVVDAIDQSPEDYAGREIEMLGFVMRNKDFAPQEFGLIRFIITCCTADASPEGFILESKDAADYKDGVWISIRGMIRVDDYDQQVVPVIEVSSIERVVQPSDPYVYP
jgi:putative membrane protein